MRQADNGCFCFDNFKCYRIILILTVNCSPTEGDTITSGSINTMGSPGLTVPSVTAGISGSTIGSTKSSTTSVGGSAGGSITFVGSGVIISSTGSASGKVGSNIFCIRWQLAKETIQPISATITIQQYFLKCYRLFRPQFSKVKTSFLLEIREVSNTLTPSVGVFGDTPV